MNSYIMSSYILDKLLYSFIPYELKQVNKYYYNIGSLLILTDKSIIYNLHNVIFNLSNVSRNKIKSIILNKYVIDHYGYIEYNIMQNDTYALERLSNITHLTLNKSMFDLSNMVSMVNLTNLNIRNNTYAIDSYIDKLVNVTSLDITNTNITSNGIKNMKNLKQISFGIDSTTITHLMCGNIILISLDELKKLTHLNDITIYYGYDVVTYTSVNDIIEI